MTLTVVLDTNVVLDLWHFDDARSRELRSKVETRALRVVTSGALDDELRDVLSRDAFVVSRDNVLARWRALAVRVEVTTPAPWLCRDPDDQKLVDLAVSARAAALISKDKALLALARRARSLSLQIVTPEDFIAALPGQTRVYSE